MSTPMEQIPRMAERLHQRLGQFIFNVRMNSFPDNDLFYIDDEDFLAACRKYYVTHKVK